MRWLSRFVVAVSLTGVSACKKEGPLIEKVQARVVTEATPSFAPTTVVVPPAAPVTPAEARAPAPAGSANRADAGLGDSKLDIGQEFLLKSGRVDLQKARDAVAKGNDPTLSCEIVKIAADTLKKSNHPDALAFVRDAETACLYEIPLAWVEVNLRKIEETRRQKPGEPMLFECARAEGNIGDLARARPDDAKVKAVTERHRGLCRSR